MSSLQENITAAILTQIRSRRSSSSRPEQALSQPSNAAAPAKLREAIFSDFDAVAELKKRWGLAADSIENWDRLWRRNPAIEQSGVLPSIGWVLEANGTIVGYLGNIPLQCRLGDKTLTAVAAHGFVVDAPYRAVGLSLASAFFRQKGVDLYLSTSAIEAVGKIAVAFKSAPVPQADYDTVLFWVLKLYPFSQALMKKLNLGPALSWAGSIVASLAVGADRILRRRWPKSVPSPYTINDIAPNDIGNDFQDLWDSKLEEGSRLFGDRSPVALRWHFEIPGARGSARVICCRENEELVGYAVVRSDTDPKNGLQKSVIADLIARQDDPAIVRALLAAAHRYSKRAGSHVLEMQGFPSGIRGVCSEWNPYQRKYPACPYYYKAADPLLHKTLLDGAAWYACPFDGDATLIRPSYSVAVPEATQDSTMECSRDILSDVSQPVGTAAG
jgi:hypothetical protein